MVKFNSFMARLEEEVLKNGTFDFIRPNFFHDLHKAEQMILPEFVQNPTRINPITNASEPMEAQVWHAFDEKKIGDDAHFLRILELDLFHHLSRIHLLNEKDKEDFLHAQPNGKVQEFITYNEAGNQFIEGTAVKYIASTIRSAIEHFLELKRATPIDEAIEKRQNLQTAICHLSRNIKNPKMYDAFCEGGLVEPHQLQAAKSSAAELSSLDPCPLYWHHHYSYAAHVDKRLKAQKTQLTKLLGSSE